MKEQSVIHIKVDYDEALQSKRDILSSERDFLRIIQRIKRYNLLRGEELNNRLRIQNKIKDLRTNLNRINIVFPKVKLPEILKRTEELKRIEEKEKQEEVTLKQEIEKETEENDIESQLREIQEKLMKLK
jgi:hypothetical protein